jgi:hypothetical protein
MPALQPNLKETAGIKPFGGFILNPLEINRIVYAKVRENNKKQNRAE